MISDALLRLLSKEIEADIYVLSSKAEEEYQNNSIHLIPGSPSDIKAFKKLAYNIKPDIIINTFEYGGPNIRSKEKNATWHNNVFAVENICSVCRVLDCRLIAFSNEYVFDGVSGPYSEESLPEAICFYGSSKHAMENACLTKVEDCAVIRTTDLYGYSFYGDEDFTDYLVNELSRGNKVFVPDSYLTNPCFVEDLAHAVLKIIEKGARGVYNIGGAEFVTRLKFAEKIAESYGLDKSLIEQKDNKDLILKKTGFVTLKAETVLGVKLSTVKSGLMALRHYMYGDKILPL